MSNHEPINLRLIVSPRPGGAELRWEADVLGARRSELRDPLPAAALGPALRALDVLQDPAYPVAWNADQQRHFSFSPAEQAALAGLGLWAGGRVHPATPQILGRRLYRALVADPRAAQALGTARDHAEALGRELAIQLCLPPQAAALAALPWELLWDAGPTPLLLGRGAAVSLARHLDLPQALPPPARAAGPLRVLAISPRAGIAPELRQVERAARTAAWRPLVESGQASVAEAEPADRAALTAALAEPPDIVHYYGHGRLRDGEGELLLDDLGEAGWTPASTLAAAFAGVGAVVLHACQGAMVETDGGEAMLGGVAQALCAAGVPVVVGMQFTVRAAAATRMAAVAYAALAEGRSVQAAIAAARRAIFVEEADRVSWAVPALYLRTREPGPVYLRPPRPAPDAEGQTLGARQVVRARAGQIQALKMQGRHGSRQQALAEEGGVIRDVQMVDE